MNINEMLDKIIGDIAETDISAYDFMVVNEIITKYKTTDESIALNQKDIY